MDPNATLKEMLELARTIQRIETSAGDYGYNDHARARSLDAGTELAELVLALDGWLRKGGAMPTEWSDSLVNSLKMGVFYALVEERGGRLTVCRMEGIHNSDEKDQDEREKFREVLRQDLQTRLRGEGRLVLVMGVWFEDEVGTDKDLTLSMERGPNSWRKK